MHRGGAGGSPGGGGSGGGGSGNPCASVVGILISCSSASHSLFPSRSIYTAGAQATSLAGCLCYDSNGTYDPDQLDGIASSCVASGEAAHPTYYSYGSLLNGFCSNNAQDGGASATVTPSDDSGSAAVTTPASAIVSAVRTPCLSAL